MPVYSSFVDIPATGWDAREYCEFPTASADSTLFANHSARYDVTMVVRHSTEYPFSDLFLSLDAHPTCKLPSSIKLDLADESGSWIGNEARGLVTYTHSLARNISLPELLNIKVSQDMNRPLLPGVLSIGILITPTSIEN